MSLGIYTRDFLFEYINRAEKFECFYCKLVSPKNYFLECKHCICQYCLKQFKECSLDGNKIIVNGRNPNAFQFIITENLLNPFLMTCIFNGCNWGGKYEDFIGKHYFSCKFRKDKELLNEYFNLFNDKKIIKKNERKSFKKKDNFYNEDKNDKNKYYNLYNNYYNIEDEDKNENDVQKNENEYNKENKEEKEENYIILENNNEEESDEFNFYKKNKYEKEKFISIDTDIKNKIKKSYKKNKLFYNDYSKSLNTQEKDEESSIYEIHEFSNYDSNEINFEIGKKRKRSNDDKNNEDEKEIFLPL